MKRRLRLVAGLLCVAVLAGCTSRTALPDPRDAPKAPPKQYTRDEAGVTASLVDHLSAVGPDLGEWSPPQDQARCAAERLVRRLTADHLLELGFDPQAGSLALPFPTDERTAVVNILIGCVNFAQGYLEVLSSFQKMTLAAAACISRGFDRLGLPRDLAVGLVDGKEPDPFANDGRISSNLAKLLVECLDKDDLTPGGQMPLLPTTSTTSSTTVPRTTTTSRQKGSTTTTPKATATSTTSSPDATR